MKHDPTSELIPAMAMHEKRVSLAYREAERSVVVIQGGRCSGKSVMIHMIAQQVSANVIDGKAEGAAAVIMDALREPDSARVLIDDLDAVLTATSVERVDLLEELIGALLRVQAAIQTGHKSSTLIGTTTLSFRGGIETKLAERLKDEIVRWHYLTSSSHFFSKCKEQRIEWWPRYWEDEWRAHFRETFRERLTEEVSECWLETIRQLSGGHPAIFGPPVELLWALTGDEPGQLDPVSRALIENSGDPGLFRQKVKVAAEDSIRKDRFRTLRAALTRWYESTDSGEKAAFAALHAVAVAGGSTMDAPQPSDARSLLEDQSLLYQDREKGQYVIPGEMLVQAVLAIGGGRSQSIALRSDSLGETGRVLVRSQRGEVEVTFSGGLWRLLRALYQRRNTFVSALELRRLAGLANERSVQNAIQRLRHALKDAGYLVESEYGKGYCLRTDKLQTISSVSASGEREK